MAEIDENLIRSELDALERAELWLERDRILEKMGLRARPGDNQYTQKGSETISSPVKTVKTTLELAKEVGYTERTFHQGKQIAKSLFSEVKEVIKGTPIAKSTTALLKVAKAGKKERQRAEKAALEAKARPKKEEAERQQQLAAEDRARQKELQLVPLRNVVAEKEAKSIAKQVQTEVQKQEEEKSTASVDVFSTQPGDQWLVARHLVYCGYTSSNEFMDCLRSNAAKRDRYPLAYLES